MNLVKTFNTGDMPETIFEILLEQLGPYFIKDGVSVYTVNGTIHDYEEDSKGWLIEEVNKTKKLDAYFISLGAKKDTRVFVYHGKFKEEPWYLNPRMQPEPKVEPNKLSEDFYFGVFMSEDSEIGVASVVLTSKVYYDRHNCLDDSLGSHSLPSDVKEGLNNSGVNGEVELMEAFWEITNHSLNKKQLTEKLIQAGFIHNENMENF